MNFPVSVNLALALATFPGSVALARFPASDRREVPVTNLELSAYVLGVDSAPVCRRISSRYGWPYDDPFQVLVVHAEATVGRDVDTVELFESRVSADPRSDDPWGGCAARRKRMEDSAIRTFGFLTMELSGVLECDDDGTTPNPDEPSWREAYACRVVRGRVVLKPFGPNANETWGPFRVMPTRSDSQTQPITSHAKETP